MSIVRASAVTSPATDAVTSSPVFPDAFCRRTGAGPGAGDVVVDISVEQLGGQSVLLYFRAPPPR